MTEQHECEWAIGQNLVLGPPKIMCSRLDCTNELPIKEAEARLNEYETLKVELENTIEISEAKNKDLNRLTVELETLKKATERLSAEGARTITDYLTVQLWKEEKLNLRAYANILEGKDDQEENTSQ